MIMARRACSVTLNHLSRFTSTVAANKDTFPFGTNFNDAERERILSTLNSSDLNELSKFNISKVRLKNLVSWKNKNGPFTTLTDLLDVDGLGVTPLEKFCQSILNNNTEEPVNLNNCSNKQKRTILTPILSREEVNKLNSAIGLHIESTGISWAKLTRDNNTLTHWNYCDFSTLPKKTTPIDTFNLAVKIVKGIPLADAYILESKQSTVSGNNSSKGITPHLHQLELSSMLLSLINTCKIGDTNDKDAGYSNKVYFLRSRLPARLFGTLVGSERVSSEAIILDIINGNETSRTQHCSKINVESQLTESYCKCTKGYKDLLEQALLLVITFMDLCIYDNPTSHKIISRAKR